MFKNTYVSHHTIKPVLTTTSKKWTKPNYSTPGLAPTLSTHLMVTCALWVPKNIVQSPNNPPFTDCARPAAWLLARLGTDPSPPSAFPPRPSSEPNPSSPFALFAPSPPSTTASDFGLVLGWVFTHGTSARNLHLPKIRSQQQISAIPNSPALEPQLVQPLTTSGTPEFLLPPSVGMPAILGLHPHGAPFSAQLDANSRAGACQAGNDDPQCRMQVITALGMIFSVTCDLELCNAISIYCISHILPTNVKSVVWTL